MANFWKRLVQAIGSMGRSKKIALVSFLVLGIVAVPGAFALAQQPGAIQTGLTYALNPISLIVTSLAVVYSVIAWAIGKMIVLALTVIIIPILGYNNFGDSNLISLGWPLVRDIVNMFVILIILYIAIRTMLGFGKGEGWQRQLPQLFLAVIAVNFSQTICVLMIDVGQVIMMTFVNALRDIAAGNFVGLFQLDSFMGIDPNMIYGAAGNAGFNSFGYLASTYAVVILLGLVLATLILLAGVFIYRIVMLWILVILSPAAFFLGGLKGLQLGSASSSYGEWWKKFVGAITLGPIMTFFLWLGLAAASQGSIAATENFESPPEEATVSGFVNEIFQVEKILSLFIGYMIIVAGFQASAGAASAFGGQIASVFSQGGGLGLLKKAAVLPAALPMRAGRAVGRSVGVPLARQVERRTGVGAAMGRSLGQAGAELQRMGGISGAVIGGTVGRGLTALGSTVERPSRAVTAEDRKAAKEAVSEMAPSEAANAVSLIGNPDKIDETKRAGALTMGQMDQLQEVAVRLVTDKGFADSAKEQLVAQHGEEYGKALFDEAKENATKTILSNKSDYAGDDDSRKKKIGKLEQKNIPTALQIIEEKNQGKAPETIQAEKEKFIKDMVLDEDFDTRNLSVGAIENPLVQEALKQRTERIDNQGRPITAWDNVQKGVKVNREVRDHINAQKSERPVPSPEEAAAEAKKSDPNEATSDDIAKAIQDGKIEVTAITKENMDNNQGNVVRGMINSNQSLENMPEEIKRSFVEGATSLREAVTAPADRRKIDIALHQATGDTSHLGVNTDGSVREGQNLTVEQAIESNPKIIQQFTTQVQAGRMDGNDTTRVISDNISEDLIKKLSNDYAAAGSSLDNQAEIAQAVDTVKSALAAEMHRALESGADTSELQEKYNQADAASRLMG